MPYRFPLRLLAGIQATHTDEQGKELTWFDVSNESTMLVTSLEVKPGDYFFLTYWQEVQNSSYYKDEVSEKIETEWFKVPAQNSWK